MWLEVSKSHFEVKRLQRRPEIRTMRPLQIRCLVRRTIFWGNITEPKNTLSGLSMARRPCDGSMQASTCSICGAGGFSFLLVTLVYRQSRSSCPLCGNGRRGGRTSNRAMPPAGFDDADLFLLLYP